MRALASDNYAGAHPEVLAAIASANEGHAPAYGADAITARAEALFREHLGGQAEVFLALTGTGANVLGLQALMHPWEAVVCAQTAHVNVDEAGAVERQLGSKVITLPSSDGKLTVEQIRSLHWRAGDVHQSQPRVVLITQATEYGTVYDVTEVRALTEAAHERGLLVFMDGARIANAAASLGVPLRAITTDAGIDAMSFGGTKNGAIMAEAVVMLNPPLRAGEHLGHIRKQFMQLASKMRFPAAQFTALLDGDLWLRNASHANEMARYLARGVTDLPGITITQPVQANAVFARLPRGAIAPLQAHTPFYTWDEATDEVRWLCSWDTTTADIDAFVEAVTVTLAALGSS